MNAPEFLIVGCGDIGRRVGRSLLVQGARVGAWVRSEASRTEAQSLGLDAACVDLDSAPIEPFKAKPVDGVFWFAPPPISGRTDDRLRRWLPRLTSRRIVYISTTAVYGDCQGRWIDESAALNPTTDRGRRRLDAEQVVAECARSTPLETLILRVPGIYGPGRLPVERLRAGHPVIAEHECPPTNRIHADDLAAVAIAAMQRGKAGGIYNVGDGSPTTMTDYFCRSARLLNLPEPPRVSLAEARRVFTPAMLSFIDESKRLLTDRVRRDLDWQPRYPDLESGLPACLTSQ